MQSRRVFSGLKGNKASVVLEEVSTPDEASKEGDKSLDECKVVEHDKLLEVLQPTEDNPPHNMIILQDFEDPFIHNKSALDHNIQCFLDWNSRASFFLRGRN